MNTLPIPVSAMSIDRNIAMALLRAARQREKGLHAVMALLAGQQGKTLGETGGVAVLAPDLPKFLIIQLRDLFLRQIDRHIQSMYAEHIKSNNAITLALEERLHLLKAMRPKAMEFIDSIDSIFGYIPRRLRRKLLV